MRQQADTFLSLHKMGMIHFQEPEGFYKRWMRRKGFDGMVTFTGRMLITKEHYDNVPLIAHEWMHLLQQRKEGKLLFAIKYTWHNLFRGYANNPYEKEARAFQHYVQNI